MEKEKISLDVSSDIFDEYMIAVIEWKKDPTEKKRKKVLRIWKKMIDNEAVENAFFEQYSKVETRICNLCGREFIPRTKKQEYCRRKSIESSKTRCTQIATRLKLCYGEEGIKRYTTYFKKVEPLNVLKEQGKLTEKVYKKKRNFYSTLYRKVNQGKMTDAEYYDAINNFNSLEEYKSRKI